MKPDKLIELDGRTGEGGGQLVRIACALAAVTTQPIRIHHVRGNRRGGGLKAQHVTAIRWLADATSAKVSGLEVGSHALTFRPSAPPTALRLPPGRKIRIEADSGASSALLIFQAVFPFLLFAGREVGSEGQGQEQEQEQEPIELEIRGATNGAFSPSWEYVDQVLLPALETHFSGIDIGTGVGGRIERRLVRRGWSVDGPAKQTAGVIWFRFRPLRPGQKLKPSSPHPLRPRNTPAAGTAARDHGNGSREIRRVDATVLAPPAARRMLEQALARDLRARLPGAQLRFAVSEDSGSGRDLRRLYALLVAHSSGSTTETETGTDPLPLPLRWGCDWLYDRSTKRKAPEQVATEIARRVCGDLVAEVKGRGDGHGNGGSGGSGGGGGGGVVDVHLQDQLVVFQALAEGRTSFPHGSSSRAGSEDAEEEAGNEVEPQPQPPIAGLADGSGEDIMENVTRAVDKLKIGEEGERRLRRDKKTHEPFGEGSTHTRTARWVASELLPTVQWFNGGTICEGAGLSCGS